MSISYIQALVSTWAQPVKEVGFPADHDDTSMSETHRVCGVIQEWIREHIVATNNIRLFGLLYLLG